MAQGHDHAGAHAHSGHAGMNVECDGGISSDRKGTWKGERPLWSGHFALETRCCCSRFSAYPMGFRAASRCCDQAGNRAPRFAKRALPPAVALLSCSSEVLRSSRLPYFTLVLPLAPKHVQGTWAQEYRSSSGGGSNSA